GKISKPLLDRFDICIEAMQIDYKELQKKSKNETSKVIRERIYRARQMQTERYRNQDIWFNSQLTPGNIRKYCKLESKEQALLEQAFTSMNLSVRAYHSILMVARTIADLDMS